MTSVGVGSSSGSGARVGLGVGSPFGLENELEDVEQIDEVSRGTLKSYASKATKDASDKYFNGEADRVASLKREDPEVRKKLRIRSKERNDDSKKRLDGVSLAFKKLTGNAKVQATEDVEQIDEISKKTLGNYVKKANDEINDRAKAYGELSAQKRFNYTKGEFNNAIKLDRRNRGIKMVVNKLTKEEQE